MGACALPRRRLPRDLCPHFPSVHASPVPSNAQLVFAVAGFTLTCLQFLMDLFTGPKPPPRSHYEAALWRGKRQVKVVGLVFLGFIFVGWGSALAYFTFLADDCSTSNMALYNLAFLLVLLLFVLVGIVVVLGCCVGLDCCISGRVKFMVLLREQPEFMPEAPHPEQFVVEQAADSSALMPGVPNRRPPTAYGSGGGMRHPSADDPFYVGAVDESNARLCSGELQGKGATWTSAGHSLPVV